MFFNSSKWNDLYGEDGQPERVICPTCEYPCRNERCVNVYCKDTDIAYVCNDCKTGWLKDDFPGELCPECGGDILNIDQFTKGGITSRAADVACPYCKSKNVLKNSFECQDCYHSWTPPHATNANR